MHFSEVREKEHGQASPLRQRLRRDKCKKYLHYRTTEGAEYQRSDQYRFFKINHIHSALKFISPTKIVVYWLSMAARLRKLIATLLTILGLAVGGMTSTGLMVPSQSEIARAEISSLGFSPEDICGDHLEHEYHCPFCHLTSEIPVPARNGIHWRSPTIIVWRQSTDQRLEAKPHDNSRVPRAPPPVLS